MAGIGLLLGTLIFVASDAAGARPTPLYGKVVTGSGRPLPGVSISLVEALGEYDDGAMLFEGRVHPAPAAVSRSDSTGSFTLVAPEPGPWIVRATKEGFAPMAIGLLPLLEESDLPTLEMPAVRKVSLDVSSVGGRRVAGARVLVSPSRSVGLLASALPKWQLDRQLVRTSSDGTATVDAGRQSSLSAWVVAHGFVPRFIEGFRGSDWLIALEPADERPLTVVDHQGRPCGDVLVWPSRGGLPLARSDETGTLELPFSGSVDQRHQEADAVELRFLARDFGALKRALRIVEKPTSTAEAPDPPDRDAPDRVMLDPPRTLRGRVLAAPGPEPLSGALVWREQAAVAFVRTGRGGDYELPRVPWYEGALRIGASGYFVDRVARRELDRFEVESRLPTIVLHPASAIAGLVTDAEGRPVEGVEVHAHGDRSDLPPFRFNPPYWERRAVGGARTRSDGRFRVYGLIPALRQILRFRRDGFAPQKVEWPAPEPGEAGDRLQVILERGIEAFGVDPRPRGRADRGRLRAADRVPAGRRVGTSQAESDP